MPPKKDAKKESEEPPKEQKLPEPFELQGYGRFQYLNGTIYQGSYRIVNNVKQKHGYGTISFPTQDLNFQEKYEGSWFEDQMEGYGTYYYANGSIYSGEWKQNQHNGRGVYRFANGGSYDGNWENHLMHGSGELKSSEGKVHRGEFRKGIFCSETQKQLVKQKQRIALKANIERQSLEFVKKLLQILQKDTAKDQFSRFFYFQTTLKMYIKGPFVNSSTYPIQKWKEVINSAKNGEFKALQESLESTVIESERLLVNQMEGNGQIVQIKCNVQNQSIQVALLQIGDSVWTIVEVKGLV